MVLNRTHGENDVFMKEDGAFINMTAQIPPTFDDTYMIRTILLSVLFLISFIGNTATLIQMYRVRKRRSTINILIVNLAVADLIVTFFAMAAEAIWTTTVQWLAGNAVCKLVRFIQGFGFLLSTYVTVVISLDRCCVIMDPISRNKAPQRVRIMVALSWFLSAIFSIPQALVFSVRRGPFEKDFYQCISFAPPMTDVDRMYNKMYNIFCLLMQFILPLTMMIVAYGLIFCTISRKSKEFQDAENTSTSSDVARGQVKNTLLHKAKRKALRMSIFIVMAFTICWFPYYVLFTGKSFGYWHIIDPNLMTGLSMVGLTNSMINPIIYGAFQLCKVNKTRAWKKDILPNTDDKILSLRPLASNRNSKCVNIKTAKNSYLALRRNTILVCRCDEVEIPKEKSASLQCVVVMCNCQPSSISGGNSKFTEDQSACAPNRSHSE